MTTKDFLTLLENNRDKILMFAYDKEQYVPGKYHITEVKNVHIDSVDCGGNQHSYDETIVQLWVSPLDPRSNRMSGEKALKIFNIVNQKKALLPETDIFFEYGSKKLATSVYRVDAVENTSDQLIVQMSVPATVCKPKLTVNALCGKGGCC